MEANRLRRGMNTNMGILFYRATKPSSKAYGSKVMKPPSSSSMASLGFVAEGNIGFVPIGKASAMVKKEGRSFSAEEESVDCRAANYISYVQERFRMEQMEYDKKY